MKTIKMTIAVMLLFCNLHSSAQAKFLDVNDPVAEYPKVTWLKGAPLEKLDKDKTYLIELWATWCKPCVAAMPHLSELHEKFKDKIVFIAQDVWEEDLEKVKAFIAANDKMMSFSIAYAGSQATSDFDKRLVKPTGTFGIPRTFIIQNNTMLWMTDPTQLNDEVLQLIVDRKFTPEAAAKLVKKSK